MAANAEARQQLHDLRIQSDALEDQLQKLQARIRESVLEQKRAEAGLEEIATIPEDRNVYRQVDHIFLCQDREALKQYLVRNVKATDESLPKLKELQQGVKERLTSVQGKMQDLAQQLSTK